MATNAPSPRVLSGMRPTGQLHLGNFHGALKNWVELQYQYECFFFVADWHALTTGYEDTSQLEENTWQMVIDWLAAGLEPVGVHAVHPVAGARARRAAPAAVDDHAARLARARAELQGPAGAAQGEGPRDLRLPRLPAAAERRHPALPAEVRAGRRGPGRARRDHPRDRAALQPRLRPRAGLRGQGREGGQAPGQSKNAALYQELRKALPGRAATRPRSAGRAALLAANPRLTVADRERLLGYLEGTGIGDPARARGAADARRRRCRGSTAARCRSPTATRSGCARTRPRSPSKLKTMQTDPARVRRTDPGDPAKCPVWDLHRIYSTAETQAWVPPAARAPASAASSARSR